MKFTIEQATAFEPCELEGLSMADLQLNAASKARAVGVWLFLLGLTDGGDTPLAKVAACEMLSDAELFIALNLPAAEFVGWFRVQSWKDFEQYEATGDDEWAFTVLMNAKAARDEMGAMATQQPICA